MGIEDKIENSELLTDIFGRFPSFHDAEVHSVTLERKERRTLPTLQLKIHVFQMTPELVNNHYVLKNHTLVTFEFSEVYGVVLEDFNHQNVLQELHVSDISDRQEEGMNFEVSLGSSFGLKGEFGCKAIRILSATPFERDGTNSAPI